MAKKKSKPNVIDGFSSVQAIKRSGKGSDEVRTRESSSRLPPKPDPSEETAQSADGEKSLRIGHTALPPRHELTCYECGYDFVLTGRLNDTICAKCRQALKVEDHLISSDWRSDIRTLGKIEVTPDGHLQDVELECGTLILAGNVEKCKVTVCRTATFRDGARFDLGSMQLKDVEIETGAEFRLRRNLKCRDLALRGMLKAKVRATGRVSLESGSTLHGEIHAANLAVADGATLKASLEIGES